MKCQKSFFIIIILFLFFSNSLFCSSSDINSNKITLSSYFVFENFSGVNSLLIIIGSLIFISLLIYYLYLRFTKKSKKEKGYTENFLDDDFETNFKPPKFNLTNKTPDVDYKKSNYDEIANLLRETNELLDELERN
ncbi:MAG: hypothetical protein ACOCRX_01650 [Candidatus Woesearchaeota archaeon]